MDTVDKRAADVWFKNLEETLNGRDVDYLVVTNGMNHYCCKMDYTTKDYVFLSEIPNYNFLSSQGSSIEASQG